MKIFFDTSIPIKICRAIEILDEEGDHFLHLNEKFDQNASDPTWLMWAKKNGYAIITGDINISKNKHEKKLLNQLDLMAFFYAKRIGNEKLWKQASILIAAYPKIREIVRDDGNHKLYEITLQGKVNPK